jgi:hypothetical protein
MEPMACVNTRPDGFKRGDQALHVHCVNFAEYAALDGSGATRDAETHGRQLSYLETAESLSDGSS